MGGEKAKLFVREPRAREIKWWLSSLGCLFASHTSDWEPKPRNTKNSNNKSQRMGKRAAE